jgi:hypothetical protein
VYLAQSFARRHAPAGVVLDPVANDWHTSISLQG